MGYSGPMGLMDLRVDFYIFQHGFIDRLTVLSDNTRRESMAIRAHWIALLFMASAASVGCESDAYPSDPSAPLLLAVELPPMSQKALIMASAELAYAAVTISGASESDQPNASVEWRSRTSAPE